MKIRLVTSIAGGYTFAAGDEPDLPDEVAADLVRAGHAEYVGTKPHERAQTATSQQAKKAERR